MNEIRNYGDQETIVLYTDDKEVFNNLKDSAKCKNIVDYYKHGKLVGWDMYFDKKDKQWVKKNRG